MFTGIIGDIGEIKTIKRDGGMMHAQILTHDDPLGIDLGASIACDGVCLTVTRVEAVGEGALFSVDISQETLDVTNLDSWAPERAVNLERAMRIGEEIGGHIVSGHVDGKARIAKIVEDGKNRYFTFEVGEDLAKYIAPKGSVALNGTSLTVNKVSDAGGHFFECALIPHTLDVTTWGQAKEGQIINIEVDMMARYVARLREFD